MAGAIRRVAVERGVDPRDFELVAFGGAGPLHAAEIAASLDLAGVVVPPHPGLTSAFGTLLADRRVDRRWTHYARSGDVDVAALAARLDAMEQDARAALAAEGFAGEPVVTRSLALRYAGQSYEREVPLAPGPFDRGRAGGRVRGVQRAAPRGLRLQLPRRAARADPRRRDRARPGRTARARGAARGRGAAAARDARRPLRRRDARHARLPP